MKYIKKSLSVLLCLTLAVTFVFLPAQDILCICEKTALNSKAEETLMNVSFNGKYCQSSARSMTEMINDFRTNNNPWMWDENGNKVYCSSLSPLTFDYELEKVAMQRASELVAAYSHTRPDGTSCFTAYPETYSKTSARGENIAIGTSDMTAEITFNLWKEENESYSGQGHRRNMLSTNYKAVGIAHVYYNGCHYWVQEFSSDIKNTNYISPDDSFSQMNVTVASNKIKTNLLSAKYSSFSVLVGEENELPEIHGTLRTDDTWGPSIEYTPSAEWSVTSGTNIISITDDKFRGLTSGYGKLTAKSGNNTKNITVHVINSDIENFTYTAEEINGYTGSALNVVVPSAIDGNRITSIAEYTFDSKNMKTVKIPEGIEKINCNAFYGCDKMESITLPSSLTYIADESIGYDTNSNRLENFTIYCHAETTAETYAKNNGINCVILPPCNHDYTENVIKAPTCTQKGVTSYKCTKCGKTYNEEIQPMGHSFGNWEIVKDSTCSAEGEKKRKCTRCQYEETASIPVKSHSFTEEIVSPTCTKNGYTLYKCTSCNYTYTNNEIKPLGHSFGNWEIVKDSTCSAVGEKKRKCTRCQYEETASIPVKLHSFTEEIVSPTCTENGYTLYKCTSCNYAYTDNEIKPLGHSFGDWEIVKDSTCSAVGEKKRKCTRCQYEETASIPVKLHSFTKKIVSPTCTKGGYTLYKCTSCGYSYKGSETKPKGHNFVKIKVVKPTLNSQGYTLYKCTACGTYIKRNYTSKLISITKAKISKISSAVYTGRQIKPAVKIVIGKTLLKNGRDYKITYASNKIGKGSLTINGIGRYAGKVVRTFAIYPRRTSVISLKISGKKIFALVNRKPEANIYQLQYSTNSKFLKSKTVSSKSTKFTINGTKGKIYYFRVRTVKSIGKVNYSSGWSSARKIRIK